MTCDVITSLLQDAHPVVACGHVCADASWSYGSACFPAVTQPLCLCCGAVCACMATPAAAGVLVHMSWGTGDLHDKGYLARLSCWRMRARIIAGSLMAGECARVHWCQA